MKTPMMKIMHTVKEYLDANTNPFISPTVLYALMEQAEKLIVEEENLLKRSFSLGLKVKNKDVDAEKAAVKFYTNNFVTPQVGNPKSKTKTYG
jgi:hypothetical protein